MFNIAYSNGHDCALVIDLAMRLDKRDGKFKRDDVMLAASHSKTLRDLEWTVRSNTVKGSEVGVAKLAEIMEVAAASMDQEAPPGRFPPRTCFDIEDGIAVLETCTGTVITVSEWGEPVVKHRGGVIIGDAMVVADKATESEANGLRRYAEILGAVEVAPPCPEESEWDELLYGASH